MVSVGLSKVVHIETVSFLRMKLPESSRVAILMPRFAVLDSQTRLLVEPLMRRRLPLDWNVRVAVESVMGLSAPAIQSGIPLYEMAAMYVLGDWEMKPNKKVLLGDVHVVVGFVADKD